MRLPLDLEKRFIQKESALPLQCRENSARCLLLPSTPVGQETLAALRRDREPWTGAEV